MFSFLRFACSNGWISDNPLKHFRNAPLRRVKQRRAFTEAEFQRLITTSNGTTYLVAGLSGFRRGELMKMQARDVSLPYWTPRAEIVKGRRKEMTPILPDLIPTLRSLLEGREPTDRLLTIPSLRAFRRDLIAAQIALVDGAGRIVDFHSFRYTFCTLMARRLPIQTVKALMRHKDIRLTCNLYCDLGLTDIMEAFANLPSLGFDLPKWPLPLTLSQIEKTAENIGILNKTG